MNLRIADPGGLVAALHHLLGVTGDSVLRVDGWSVVPVDGRLFYRSLAAADGGGALAVGGPYPDLGSLLRDVGWQKHASWKDGPPRVLVWDVVAWGGAFFTVHSARLESPTRRATLEEAVAAGRAGEVAR
jgi:hypothetical protein